jgi:hypothetical protein
MAADPTLDKLADLFDDPQSPTTGGYIAALAQEIDDATSDEFVAGLATPGSLATRVFLVIATETGMHSARHATATPVRTIDDVVLRAPAFAEFRAAHNITASATLTAQQRLAAIDRAIGEAQAARLLARAGCSRPSVSATEMDVAVGAVSEELGRIACAVGVPISQSTSGLQVVRAALDAVCRAMQRDSRALGVPLFDRASRAALQEPRRRRAVEDANAALAADCALRHEVMRKRAEVTLQGFFWSQRGKDREAELRAEITRHMPAIAAPPMLFGVEDVLMARSELAAQHTAKVSAGRSSSRLPAHIIGDVPDRGGRPLESREAIAAARHGTFHGRARKGAPSYR